MHKYVVAPGGYLSVELPSSTELYSHHSVNKQLVAHGAKQANYLFLYTPVCQR